jgi:DNA-3-methyladenine glycosylase
VTEALTRASFERPAPVVAPTLLGRHLVRQLSDGRRRRIRIVETEAYERDDPPSHSFRGETARTAAMFGPPGHLYVYLIYGLHHCLNVVTGSPGHGAAVLLRAAEPLEGLDAMAASRGVDDVRRLCRGPARLAQALAIDRSSNGADLLREGEVWLEPGERVPQTRVTATRRIGISTGTEELWRWVETGSPWATPTPGVSRSPAAPRP